MYDFSTSVIGVVGLGYVGLPLAEAFSRHFKVVGFDIDEAKIKQMPRLTNRNINFTSNPHDIAPSDFIIICVPTPLTKSMKPDLSCIKGAAKTIGANIKKGCIVILESSVYPGVTEEILKPALEKASGLRCSIDFKIAYSPERINPGDSEHTINSINKVVAGMDEPTTEAVAALYSHIVPQVYKAKNIKVAEASKVFENVQRDLNIALTNEMAIILSKMGLNIKDVIDAAATKWNFHRYSPGLVGGYCIPVVPHYLIYKAEKLGYYPRVISAGRVVNDSMSAHATEIAIAALKNAGKTIKISKVLVMGLTYKENVADFRESPSKTLIKELKKHGVKVYGYDPLIEDIEKNFGIEGIKNLNDITDIAVVIITVAHDQIKSIKIEELKSIMNNNPVILDLKQVFDRDKAEKAGFFYQTF